MKNSPCVGLEKALSYADYTQTAPQTSEWFSSFPLQHQFPLHVPSLDQPPCRPPIPVSPAEMGTAVPTLERQLWK